MNIVSIFPALADKYKKVAHGNKSASHTKRGPGRFHRQGKKKAKVPA